MVDCLKHNVIIRALFSIAAAHRELRSLAFDKRGAFVQILTPKVGTPEWRKPLACVLPFQQKERERERE
jgi:hypothetical protein